MTFSEPALTVWPMTTLRATTVPSISDGKDMRQRFVVQRGCREAGTRDEKGAVARGRCI
jgi:hypothetical protein